MEKELIIDLLLVALLAYGALTFLRCKREEENERRKTQNGSTRND